MKRLSLFALLFSLILTNPFFALETFNDNDPNMVNIAGLKREHVILALWHNATETRDSHGSMAYLLTTGLKHPTEEQAVHFLKGQSDYFHCRKVPQDFSGDCYNCRAYNGRHGLNKAQQAIQALKKLSSEGPIIPEKICTTFVPIDPQLQENENKLIHELLKSDPRKAFQMKDAQLLRYDAEVADLFLRKTTDGTSEQKEAAQKFAKGIVAINLRNMASSAMPDVSPNNKTTVTPVSPPAQSSDETKPAPTNPPLKKTELTTTSSSSTASQVVESSVLSKKTEKEMAAGLRRMFGGKDSRPR